MTAMKKIAVGLAAASAMTLAIAPAASAEGAHTIVFSNKSVVFYLSFTSRDAAGTVVKQKKTTWAAGAFGGTYKYQVPANAVSTRFTASDRGTQQLGVDLANTQHWCYRAPASWHGKIEGPVAKCDPKG
ncbi:hypothetical protein [Amycolatopsis sp. NPDC059657]|uniref:hypothetical protein n=1 Tax=Amycolatopsis sp. NPDC059657 TaxID=3346899 RepID=UPI00366DF731